VIRIRTIRFVADETSHPEKNHENPCSSPFMILFSVSIMSYFITVLLLPLWAPKRLAPPSRPHLQTAT